MAAEATEGAAGIPRARVKRIMKADEDVKQIKPEAVVLVTKATEMFVGLFVKDAFKQSVKEKRKGLQYKDMATAVQEEEHLDFLMDIVPEKRQAMTDVMRSDGDEPEPKRQKGEESLGQDTDIWLPMTNVKRLVKAKLAGIGGARVSCEQDAYRAMVRSATVYVSYLTACAQEFAKNSKRVTLGRGEIFQAIDEIDMAVFTAGLTEHLAKYGAEKEQEKSQPPAKKKKATGFIRFSLEHRKRIKRENPGLVGTAGDIAKIIGKMWRDLPDDQKEAYKAAAAAEPDKA
jgi:histone H3/H4